MGLLRGASSRPTRFSTHSLGAGRWRRFSSAITISRSPSPERLGFGMALSESSSEGFPNASRAASSGSQRARNSRHSFDFGDWSSKSSARPSDLFGSGARADSPTNGFPFGRGTTKEPTHRQSSVINHPWAHLVKPRRLHFQDLTDDQVDSTLPLDIYGHVPRDGYVSEKFARTLFPRMTSCDVRLEKLPVVELQTLRDAVSFREHSQKVMDDLLDGVYPVREYPLIKMAEMPSLLAPPTIDGRRPVLYQVVYASRENELLILEAKDFFVMLPDRLDLHCIVLNGKSINVQSHKLGFNPGLVSIKDFVWVWTVEPTDEAIGDPERILRQSRWPRLTAFDRRSAYFFRAAQFAFVRPAILSEKVYGSVLSIQGKWSPVKNKYDPVHSFKAAFEGAPEAIRLNQSICAFPLIDVQHGGEILLAESRRNVSCAIRFSEPAASGDAERQLCKLIRHFIPSHPDEGIMPIMVKKLSLEDRGWFSDRLGKFNNYKLSPENARKKMSKVFNMACSSLEACRSLDDDRRIHRVTAQVPDIFASPLRLKVVLQNMYRECGWSPGKPVLIWVKGARIISRFMVEKISNKPKEKQLEVTLVARHMSQERLVRAIAYGGIGRERFVNVWLMLGKLPTSADPLYETVVRMRLFDNLHPGSLGNTILDGVYSKRSFTPVVERPPVSKEQLRSVVLTIGGKKISLTREQQKAVLRGCAGYPVVGIPANFGSGKTLVAAVMAALSKKERVILTGDTNEVVAKVANTLCSIEEFKDRKVLRYVSLRTTWKDRDSTPVDMDQVLKNLGDDFSRDVESMADRSICRRFRERLSVSLTAQEREELELVETNVSPLLKDMPAPMMTKSFTAHPALNTPSCLVSYGENLVDGAVRGERRLALDLLPFPHPKIPFLFVDVVGSNSDVAESKSSFNVLEAEVCERVIRGLLAKGLKTKEITIVNFYKEQQRRLEEFAQDIGVENTTVESFQNSHNEVVVLLTTKAELELPYIYGPRREKVSDFLEEAQRLVTALTRARQGLIILGSEYFLSRGRNWEKIINWAIEFKGVMKSSELHKFLGDPITTRKVQDVSGSPRPRFQGLSRL
ncbi:hypothetical protein ANCCAN_18071 [Ancylostoma caninum]|uniref:DNA2/NAM7 helicase-like C-terminal domain-containing protein n=1 Tax=Ancylostoma caninum TaxID=29170 RepID=A0A368FVD5_ANCCA|nr:hypothetical protein ANCCAN_18071 [Ancylostoma caninum]